MKSFIYEHIHTCRWIKITLSYVSNSKLQAQALHSCISHGYNRFKVDLQRTNFEKSKINQGKIINVKHMKSNFLFKT
jgi:hypothetical protein